MLQPLRHRQPAPSACRRPVRIPGATWALAQLLAMTGAAIADEQTEQQPGDLTVEQLVEQVRPSLAVVSVSGRDGRPHGVGTGFVVDSDGLIATNLHVIGEGRSFSVELSDKRRLEVVGVHASDRRTDLAIIQVQETDLPALELGELSNLNQGAPIVVMGNPHGLKASVVTGVNSGVRDIDGRKMLQIAIPVEPGNSGGPVLGHDGRVYGVVTLKSAVTNNLGFAGDVATLRKLLDKPNPVAIAQWRKIGTLDPDKWETRLGANWRQWGGRIAVTGVGSGFGGRSLCLARQLPPQTPYEVAVDVRLDDEAGAAGLVFHSDGGERHYGFYPSAGKLRLTLFDGPVVYQWKILHDEPSKHYRAGDWNTLKVRVEQERVLGFVNDQLVVESTDDRLATGMVGLAKFRTTEAEFRNFRVAREIPPTQLSSDLRQQFEERLAQLPGRSQVVPQQLGDLIEESRATRQLILEQARKLERQAEELRQLQRMIHVLDVAQKLESLIHPEEEDQDNQHRIDLLRAAMLIALVDDAEIDIDAYLEQVDRMAHEVKEKLDGDASEEETIAALDEYLFREQGFHGSRFDYENRANSYLNRVMTDREGIPISLSVLYMEVGRRLDLNIEGIGLPGHFVVRYRPSEGSPQVIDVFHEAKRLDRAALEELTARYGRPFDESLLTPEQPAAILTRMLNNLLRIAEREGDRQRMLGYLELMVAIDPDSVQARGMRAVLRHETGQNQAAIADLDWILQRKPPGLDLQRIEQMKEFFSRGNN